MENDFSVLFWEADKPLLTLDKTEVSLSEYGQTDTVAVKETSSEEPVKWSSDNEKIATVDENGLITATGNGTCNIIAETGNAKAYCSVKVAYDYYIEPAELTMKIDEAKSITIYSKNTGWATELEAEYTSSNEDVADVTKRGIIYTNVPGVAEIHAVIGEVDMVCMVTVEGEKCDVNVDGEFNISDVVLLEKWLLAVPDTHLDNRKAADLYEDDQLDAFDLCLMKKLVNSNE